MADKITKFSGGLQVGSFSTAQIPSGLENGTIYYNTDTNTLEQFVNNATQPISSDSINTTTILNDQSIPANVTGFVVDKTLNKAFTADVSVVREVTASGFNPNYFNGNNKKVNGFLEFSGSTVVFGDFDKGLYLLNSSGVKDSAFDTAIGTGFNDEVTAVFEDNGGLIVFGKFTAFNGQTRNRVCFLTNTGNDDLAKYLSFGTSMNNGSGFDGPVLSAAKYLGGYAVIGTFFSFNGGSYGSSFISISTMTPGSIGIFNSPLGLFSPKLAVNDLNFNIILADSGNAYLYTSVISGGAGINFLTPSDIPGNIYDIKVSSNVLYLAGDFATIKTNASPFLGKIDLTSPTYDFIPFTNSLTFTGALIGSGINQISFTPSGLILCCGKFSGYSKDNIIALNSDGTENGAFNSNLPAGITSPISSGIQLSTNEIYFASGQVLSNASDSYTYTYSTQQTYVKTLRLDGAYNRQSDVITFTESIEYAPVGGIDETGVTLSMDANGQLQYTSTNLPTNTSYLKYKLTLL